VEGFDPRQYLDRRERKRLATMPRAIQMAVAAAALARRDATLGTDDVEPARLGVVFGAGTIPHDLADLADAARFATESDPERIDRGRDGRVIGEGGGVVLLEALDHAARRGARAYAEVIGFGSAWGPPADGEGLTRSARAALDEAGIGPERIDHVNARGASTPD